MSFLWISALKDFRRRLADPVAMAMWLGIPLVIGLLMGLAFGGGGGVTPKAKLLLADQDDSFVTRALAGMLTQAGGDSMVELERVELEAGRARMEEGDASGLLVLPEGFGRALLLDEPTELRLVTNPAQQILPGILRKGLEILVEVVFYAQRIFGAQLRLFAQGPPTGDSFFADAVIASQSIAINEKLRGLKDVLFPPVLDFETEILVEEDSAPQGVVFLLFPGILLMSLLFIAQGMSDDLWEEKESGTLARVLSTPHGLSTFVGGKLVASTLIMGLIGGIGLLLGTVVFDFPSAAFLPGLAWCVLCGAALFPLFLFVQILASSRKAGNILSTVLLFPLMMIGGSLFPLEAMPGWMAEIGGWTPNGVAVIQLKAILAGEVQLGLLVRDAALLAAGGGVLFLLTLRRVSGRFLQS